MPADLVVVAVLVALEEAVRVEAVLLEAMVVLKIVSLKKTKEL